MGDFLADWYPWIKAFHLMSVISWMAGLFYLPRLFVYHAERAEIGSELSETLKVMEYKLLKFIMNPASIATWIFGLMLVFTPGIVDWSTGWPWVKGAAVITMTWFHHRLVHELESFKADKNTKTGRHFRLMNEIPTVLMLVIVIMVIVKPF
ncbi:protoporphyrinogen oxidase HemJ [Rhodobacteraceae bacterium NNCM2]|nr:protoporphyrinogen oxidase HemJ [Coraliihabitans acroporae]